MAIKENFQNIKKEIPKNVEIVLAAKTRTPEEIREIVKAGAKNIGENYVQEADNVKEKILSSKDVLFLENFKNLRWHLIGPLQKGKINKALRIFDFIQSLDSLSLARELDKRIPEEKVPFPVLLQVNIGNEENKSGFPPEKKKIKEVCEEISKMNNISLQGLMTIEPLTENPEDSRKYFKNMNEIFDYIKKNSHLNLEKDNLKYLSMGMSNTYKMAIEEGSNMIRPGRVVFGERNF